MAHSEMMPFTELSDTELDMVAAAGSHVAAASLVNINIPVQINLGVALANQTNLAVFSIATQGGAQSLALSAIALAVF